METLEDDFIQFICLIIIICICKQIRRKWKISINFSVSSLFHVVLVAAIVFVYIVKNMTPL